MHARRVHDAAASGSPRYRAQDMGGRTVQPLLQPRCLSPADVQKGRFCFASFVLAYLGNSTELDGVGFESRRHFKGGFGAHLCLKQANEPVDLCCTHATNRHTHTLMNALFNRCP
jgi:hypothetical protein